MLAISGCTPLASRSATVFSTSPNVSPGKYDRSASNRLTWKSSMGTRGSRRSKTRMTGKIATKTWKAMAAARMPSAPSATPTTKKRNTFHALIPSNPHGWMRSSGATRSHLSGVFFIQASQGCSLIAGGRPGRPRF